MSGTPDKPASEVFDLTHGMGETELDAEAITDLAADLEQAEAYPAEDQDAVTLAELSGALRRLEAAAENARKDIINDELNDRVAVGEQVGPVEKREGRNTWVEDDEAAFAAVAETGEDPMDVAQVSISDLRDVLGDKAAEKHLGEATYQYFRRRD